MRSWCVGVLLLGVLLVGVHLEAAATSGCTASRHPGDRAGTIIGSGGSSWLADRG